ncbi:MAG: MarR family transcriptional regulator [Pusillimonas sp.]|jgi:DNA-binding MarR family transcriptional regulator|nr:MarR family transcriptional regulator [Pusillimonas sp.]
MSNQKSTQDTDAIDQSFLLRQVGYNCLQAYLKIEPDIKKRLTRYQLKPVEFTVLSLISSNPGINQKRLGHTINVSPPNLATLLDKMELRELLARKRNPNDKRSQILELTDKGQTLFEKAKQQFEKNENIPYLSSTEQKQLLVLLQKIFL